VVRKCLAKDPDERWQNTHDLKTALQWVGDAASSDRLPVPMRTAPRWRERVAWTLAAALLLVSVVALGFARRTGHDMPGVVKPIRFSVGAPDDAAFSSSAGFMALSPDGTDLAFVATPSGSQPLLWIHSLDSLTPRPMAGTIGATSPFWSPDGRSVAFITDRILKRVDIATGIIETICTAGLWAGTWGRNDVILFMSDRSGGIERVPAAGGRPTPVTVVDRSRGEFQHHWPQFLPDGRHFLYVVRSSRPEYAGIYVASLDGGERMRLLSEDSQAVYVAPGYLLFRRQTTVLAQRFDAAMLKLSGEALPIASDVAFNPGTGRATFSASDTGMLAYRTEAETVLSWFDRAGTVRGTIGPPGRYRDPALSPDGRTVAVARLDPRAGTHNIWLIDADRDAATRLTFDPQGDSAPTWSPDGTRILFASRRGGRSDLYVKASTGNTPEELLYAAAPAPGFSPLDWSRDGRFVLFGGNDNIWVLPLVGERKPFAVMEKTPAGQGQLSPDRRWLAYSSNETGSYEVYVRPFPRTSTGKWRISDHGGIEPKWGRDGKELFYIANDQRLMAVGIRTAAGFDAAPPAALFETPAVGSSLGVIGRNQYDIAPDDRRFLFSRPARGASKPITLVVNWSATLRVDARSPLP
jgi:Tol biopolymer transport system component